MRTRVAALGVVGGVLALLAGVAALVRGDTDTAVIGAWVTIGAGLAGGVGGVLAWTHPGWGTVLLSAAVVAAGLVAPGVIPAIADVLLVFFAYVASGIFLLLGAIFAFRVRRGATVGLARPEADAR